MDSSVLITGAAGFIGSNLTKKLSDNGYLVLPTDIVGEIPKLDARKIENWKQIIEQEEINEDWTIIHLASFVGSHPSFGKPWEFIENNVLGTLSLLEAMRQYSINKLIFMSSACVYGTKTNNIIINEETPLDSDSPYGLSKKFGEELVIQYGEQYGLNSLIYRPVVIYGPHQKEKNVIQQIVDSAITGNSFTIFGDGSHIRMPLYIDDVLSAFKKGIDRLEKVKGNETYCIASTKPIDINHMTKIARKYSDFSVEKMLSKYAFNQVVDSSKIRRILNWMDEVTVEDGIKKCISA